MNGVKEMALEPVGAQPVTLAKPVAEDNMLSTFERLARDSSMDVEKLDRLMQMHERASARFAEEQFNRAMSEAQKAMRPIAANAENPQTKSKYASYAALDKALRPLYTEHGFGLSFDTGDGAPAGWVRVLCYVTHAGGHARTYHADMPADGKGARGGDVMTVTHAVGAAMSYGMRYLLKMIFNVAVGEEDRDGNTEEAPSTEPPKGYDRWFEDFSLAADNGNAALRQAFTESPQAFRDYLVRQQGRTWNDLKVKASAVTKAAKLAAQS